MVLMAYLPSRWDSEDEATGPQMDETTTVETFSTDSIRGRRQSVRPRPPGAGTCWSLIPPNRSRLAIALRLCEGRETDCYGTWARRSVEPHGTVFPGRSLGNSCHR